MLARALQVARLLQDVAEHNERMGDLRVLGPVSRLDDLQRAVPVRACVFRIEQVLQDVAEVLERTGDLWVLGP